MGSACCSGGVTSSPKKEGESTGGDNRTATVSPIAGSSRPPVLPPRNCNTITGARNSRSKTVHFVEVPKRDDLLRMNTPDAPQFRHVAPVHLHLDSQETATLHSVVSATEFQASGYRKTSSLAPNTSESRSGSVVYTNPLQVAVPSVESFRNLPASHSKKEDCQLQRKPVNSLFGSNKSIHSTTSNTESSASSLPQYAPPPPRNQLLNSASSNWTFTLSQSVGGSSEDLRSGPKRMFQPNQLLPFVFAVYLSRRFAIASSSSCPSTTTTSATTSATKLSAKVRLCGALHELHQSIAAHQFMLSDTTMGSFDSATRHCLHRVEHAAKEVNRLHEDSNVGVQSSSSLWGGHWWGDAVLLGERLQDERQEYRRNAEKDCFALLEVLPGLFLGAVKHYDDALNLMSLSIEQVVQCATTAHSSTSGGVRTGRLTFNHFYLHEKSSCVETIQYLENVQEVLMGCYSSKAYLRNLQLDSCDIQCSQHYSSAPLSTGDSKTSSLSTDSTTSSGGVIPNVSFPSLQIDDTEGVPSIKKAPSPSRVGCQSALLQCPNGKLLCGPVFTLLLMKEFGLTARTAFEVARSFKCTLLPPSPTVQDCLQTFEGVQQLEK